MAQGTISIPDVRSAFAGRVIAPGDPEYDRARSVHDGSVDRRPAVIIRPADAAEVARVVALARETRLELRSEERRVGKECRSGGSPDHEKEKSDRCTAIA